MFERELNFFIANQDRLVAQYDGKTLVLRGDEVVSVHDSALDAYLDATKKYQLGTFMIQPCSKGPDAYTVTITTHGILPVQG
jgi:hypothetical protein